MKKAVKHEKIIYIFDEILMKNIEWNFLPKNSYRFLKSHILLSKEVNWININYDIHYNSKWRSLFF